MKKNTVLKIIAVLAIAAMILGPMYAVNTGSRAAAEDAQPALLVTVNGTEICDDNADLLYMVSYYQYLAQNYGYDLSDQNMVRTINAYSLTYTIQAELIRQKAAELGLAEITAEDKAALEADGKAKWEETVQKYMTNTGKLTAESTDEDKAAVRAEVEAGLLQIGYDEARYVSEYVDKQTDSTLTGRVIDYLVQGKEVTDEEISAYYDSLVQKDKETYENSIGTYEFYTQYYGQNSYYRPEGYRGVIHILLKADEEALNKWKDLKDRLKEQQSADATATEAPAEGSAEPTAEPVTEEMVKEAEEAVLLSVQATVDEIMGKLESGVSFTDLVKEYGSDPGMQDEKKLAEGYPVHKDSIMYDQPFTDAAMVLEKPGDVGKPVVGQYGVHILQYLRDIPGGAAEMTEAMKEEFRAALTDEMKNNALNSALDQWMLEADVVYTEEGRKWKADTQEQAAGTTEETDAETPADGR